MVNFVSWAGLHKSLPKGTFNKDNTNSPRLVAAAALKYLRENVNKFFSQRMYLPCPASMDLFCVDSPCKVPHLTNFVDSVLLCLPYSFVSFETSPT